MNHQQLRSILQANYQRNDWLKVLQYMSVENSNRLQDTLHSKSLKSRLNNTEKKTITELIKIGTFIVEGEKIPIYEAHLHPNIRINRNRVQVNNIIKKIIRLDATKAALCVFHYPKKVINEWRFSFIAKATAFEFFAEAEGEEETTPKRYTYIFGTKDQHRTAIQRFSMLRQSTFDIQDLFDAFAVEALSKEFFAKYKAHYQAFVDEINGSTRQYLFDARLDGKDIRDFVKKTLGRIIFLYFVQKKGWMGATSEEYDDGEENFLQNYFEFVKDEEEENIFYSNYLVPLFFETLNRQRPNDEFEMPDGKTVRIPYLNGGLFEKENEKLDLLNFSPELFENLFDFLNSYNFTVYENSPDDHAVAVDPEMLGNIFENLLEDNKDKGAYYTPKEIVHYMCQQSLIEYLDTQLKVQKQTIDRTILEQFVKHKTIEILDENHQPIIDKLLDEVKICDPAIGSGAFPMGLLQEIFNLKISLHPIDDVAADKQDKHFATIKTNIIQNSIYGVDIEKGAVDIARLRFWLSLVVDEKTPKALPNLDYKIVVGNSLVSMYENEPINIDWQIVGQTDLFGNETEKEKQKLLQKITKIQKQFFTVKSKEKGGLNKKIQQLKTKILIKQLEVMIDTKGTSLNKNKKPTKKQLELYAQTQHWKNILRKLRKIQSNNQPLNFFDWRLDFPEVLNPLLKKEKTGFDIVIGNPPYIQLQKENGKLAKLYKPLKFKTFASSGDIYMLFYERGMNLLGKKGVLSYITSNKWIRAKYGKVIRKYFLKETNPLQLIDFGQAMIFETAIVHSNILLLQKDNNNNNLQACRFDEDFHKGQSIDFYLNKNGVALTGLNEEVWAILPKKLLKIKKHIENIGIPLREWNIKINFGIKTGYNKAFIINKQTRDFLVAEEPNNKKIIKPILRGRDTRRYYANFANLWLIHSHNGTKEIPRIDIPNDYPIIYDYLLEHEAKAKARYDKGSHWTNLRNCAYFPEFENPKIIFSEIVSEPQFYYDTSGMYPEATVFFISGKNLKYLIAFLNSKAVTYFFTKFYAGGDLVGKYRYKKAFLENLPIPKIEKSQQIPFETLVDYILYLYNSNKPINEYVENEYIAQRFEEVIDAMVMELYFEEDFKKAQLAFIEYAQRDFKALPKKEEDKRKVIHAAYQKLRERKNEIRNNLKLMDIRLEELVMPIKNA